MSQTFLRPCCHATATASNGVRLEQLKVERTPMFVVLVSITGDWQLTELIMLKEKKSKVLGYFLLIIILNE